MNELVVKLGQGQLQEQGGKPGKMDDGPGSAEGGKLASGPESSAPSPQGDPSPDVRKGSIIIDV